jgi:hypothetical protein
MTTGLYQSLSSPKYTYTMTVGDIIVSVREGYEPNWFHRKMQTLILGIKWKKI